MKNIDLKKQRCGQSSTVILTQYFMSLWSSICTIGTFIRLKLFHNNANMLFAFFLCDDIYTGDMQATVGKITVVPS